MKKTFNIGENLMWAIIVLCLSTCTAIESSCQTLYGYAGQNTAVNYTPEVRGYINDLNSDFVIDFCQYKYSGAAPQNDINNIIALRDLLQTNGHTLYLIYSFDARALQSLSDNFYAFNQLTAAGVNIIACRLGNEEWAKVAHNSNWSLYMTHCTPIINELNSKGYSGKIIFPIRRPAEAGTWNGNAITFINSNPQYEPDCHPYYNATSAPVLVDIDAGRSLPAEIVSSNSYLLSKDIFYSDLYNQITGGNFYTEFINYHRANFPNKKLWISEFGPAVGVGPISGALGYEATYDWFLNKTRKDSDIIAAVCRFNGPGITGSITPYSPKDVTGTGFIKRLGYYTLAQFLRNNATEIPTTPISSGSYTFSFHNMQRQTAEGIIPIAEGSYILNFEYEFLSGENYYSSSGACAWWLTGSEKTYDIQGSSFADEVPPLSYGYIHITVCRNNTYMVIDSTQSTIQVANICPKKCGGFIYKIFHGSSCSGCGGTHPETIWIKTERYVIETICN